MKKSDVLEIMDLISEVSVLKSEAGSLLAYGDVDGYEKKMSESRDLRASIRRILYGFCEDN